MGTPEDHAGCVAPHPEWRSGHAGCGRALPVRPSRAPTNPPLVTQAPSSPPEELIRRHDYLLRHGAAPESPAESAASPTFPGTTPRRMPRPCHPKHFFGRAARTCKAARSPRRRDPGEPPTKNAKVGKQAEPRAGMAGASDGGAEQELRAATACRAAAERVGPRRASARPTRLLTGTFLSASDLEFFRAVGLRRRRTVRCVRLASDPSGHASLGSNSPARDSSCIPTFVIFVGGSPGTVRLRSRGLRAAEHALAWSGESMVSRESAVRASAITAGAGSAARPKACSHRGGGSLPRGGRPCSRR